MTVITALVVLGLSQEMQAQTPDQTVTSDTLTHDGLYLQPGREIQPLARMSENVQFSVTK